jgi:hypothetical protein
MSLSEQYNQLPEYFIYNLGLPPAVWSLPAFPASLPQYFKLAASEK